MAEAMENKENGNGTIEVKIGKKLPRIMEQDTHIALKSMMWMQQLLWQWGKAL